MLITSEYTKYQLKASMSLKPNRFKQFALEVYDEFECPKQAKQATNGFIRLLGKSHITKHQHYFESDYNVIANEPVNHDDNIHVTGIYR